MRQEKLEAMRFLEEKYDEKSKQLKFYPKTNKRMATQKDRTWKDIDGYDNIPVESKIQLPNSSVIEAQEYMTFKPKWYELVITIVSSSDSVEQVYQWESHQTWESNAKDGDQ